MSWNKNNYREMLAHGTDDFPIGIYHNHFPKGIQMLAPLHYHDEFEVFLVTEGCIYVQLEEQTFCLKEGESLFINSGLLHTIWTEESACHTFIAVVFHPGFLAEGSDIITKKYLQPLMDNKISVNPLLSRELSLKITNMADLYESEGFGFEIALKQLLLSCMYEILQGHSYEMPSVSDTKRLLVKEVLDYIRDYYDTEITLQNLAESAHISREYLCRIFHEMSGNSPIEYLNRYRIEQSTEFLLYSKKNVAEIAQLSGFNNSSYYNKLFLRYMGCTPSEFRRKYRKAEK